MLTKLEKSTHLLDGEQALRRNRNKDYMMSLKIDNLLLSHYFEAGLKSFPYQPKDIHWGWDSPLSEIRGTFVGHWLSAASNLYVETKDPLLKHKADTIVSEIVKCQRENGGLWAFPIPEKYLYWLKNGKSTWAPQYVCHKNMMGLLDMYMNTGNEEALDIVLKCADWFYDFTNDITREVMDEMMEKQETGAMMQHFANLYAVTKEDKHLELMRRYERPLLFEPLTRDEDVLTNMHVNTTIPEILGAARAYEVTGEDRYLTIVKNYWDLAVTKRGSFVTGGQSSGEVYTPMLKQSARIGKMTQEHCVVYHMMQLTDFLFRFTTDSKYADYIEKNLYNGIFAQGYYESRNIFQCLDGVEPQSGLVTYYLPLSAGSTKKWGSKTDDFWCCHCTLLQANAIHHTQIYYTNEENNSVYVAQYLPSTTEFNIDNKKVFLEQTIGEPTGETIRIQPESIKHEERPNHMESHIKITCEPCEFTLQLRLPNWLAKKAEITINGNEIEVIDSGNGFCSITRVWSTDTIIIKLPKKLTAYPLPDRPDTVAFLDGPVALAGLVGEEHLLYGDINHPETMLTIDDERIWCSWQDTYRTINQPIGFRFKPLYQIGFEPYTVYFQVTDNH